MSIITVWVFRFHHNSSFWVLSQGVFFFFYFITILVFEFQHNLSFWVSSQFEFLNFITIWAFEFHHNLSFWFSSQYEFWVTSQFECLCVCVSVSQTHIHTDTQTNSLTDRHKLHYNQWQISTCVLKIKFWRKKLYTKTLFAPNFVLAMVVSETVLERQLQGLFKSGTKSCTYSLTFIAN